MNKEIQEYQLLIDNYNDTINKLILLINETKDEKKRGLYIKQKAAFEGMIQDFMKEISKLV